jgi:UDP-GlcNAc:undecaprenyl-phosphate GlcNAc-1-phosphate transferase
MICSGFSADACRKQGKSNEDGNDMTTDKKYMYNKTIRVFITLAAVVLACLWLPPVRRLFFDTGDRWLYILLFSFSTSALLTPAMIAVATRLGVVDNPGGRKIHSRVTPLMGGVAIVVSFISALTANMILDSAETAIIACGVGVAAVSLADDWKDVRASYKLAVQVAAVCVLIHFGVMLELFPILTTWGYLLNAALSILWIVGLTNAMNFIDGMDGLATGVSTVISAFLAVVAYQTSQPLMGWIALAMLGSCVGFFPFNFGLKRPAFIFLGDAGSAFMGFVLSALAIKADWADNNPIVSFVTPILIFWVLIYDMAYISVERIITGKVKNFREWIDFVGTDHIHHRLFAILKGKRRTVFFILFLSATIGINALTLRNADTIDGLLTVVQAFFITLIVSTLEYFGKKTKIGD